MAKDFWSEADLRQMAEARLSVEKAEEQLERFRTGVLPLRLDRPCTAGDGILVLPVPERERCERAFEELVKTGRVMKFVPASGAASRMFRDWHRACSVRAFDSAPEEGYFLKSLPDYAFYEDLRSRISAAGRSLEEWISRGSCPEILDFILKPEGLGYGSLPKALLKFHDYPEGSRTALQEHLVEAALYVRDEESVCRVHFTVSPEHRSLVEAHLEETVGAFERRFGVRLQVGLSVQDPSTDTIAVDLDNRPFRGEDGCLVFRPGGHGALLKNLDSLDGDIVFLKNIDNIVPDRLKVPTVLWKRTLSGFLVDLEGELHRRLRRIEEGALGPAEIDDMVRFCREKLNTHVPREVAIAPPEIMEAWLFARMNRPLRICGMVRNEGEPGGGPFWVSEAGGGASLQIVEEFQVDRSDPGQREIWEASTHFNPVDLVLTLRDFRGERFDLNRFVDPAAVAITRKSEKGRDLKALELPGLWNGAMAFWNTIFVEVPLETFNPVKVAEDLLRPRHRRF
ncbi:MAG: DUF4301 domain-containing protein [Deltaproteobacteria bacterium HGW-Deltaproteobacteria-19]|jgi:hypothetical protein|nr:MAG: DUF4301 domain-containing protein [Deltaproteobacteria bacterium HGW-Deltaproteobacteria-19]